MLVSLLCIYRMSFKRQQTPNLFSSYLMLSAYFPTSSLGASQSISNLFYSPPGLTYPKANIAPA